jgi:Lon protease-like protein
MGPLRELLAIDHRQTLEFFALRLQDLSGPAVDRQELLYNASVLAHYAQVSTQPDVDVPAPRNLSAVFDHFVADTTLRDDRLMMETAGAQCLLLAGFFEDQMRRHHNIRWYAELGASFFRRAALHEQSLDKARLLDAIARRFEPWRRRHAQLSRELRDQPYLLTPPVPPEPPRG